MKKRFNGTTLFENLRRRSRAAGRAPGSPLYVGPKREGPVSIEMITYDAAGAEVSTPRSLEECACFGEGTKITWVNIDGLHDMAVNNQAGEVFKLHPLVLEDIVDTGQRPKMEELHDGGLFVVVKMLTYNEKERHVEQEQVSFILGKRYLLTFQEHPGNDVFGEVRKRLTSQKGKIGSLGPDYLLYALLDAVVDHYFVVLERMGEDIEEIEEMLLARPKAGQLEALHGLRREALFLRRYIFPMREVIARLEKGGLELITENTSYYLRDLYDHTIQVMDTVETFRDMLNGMAELYLSNISLKMDEIMKVLAMFTSLFTPLTFLAGIYGMNFKNIPELDFKYGYFGLLGVMGVIALGMMLFFRRKGWLGNNEK